MYNRFLISVIMPCYNAEPFIAEAIQSVIGQTYTNWEMLICDDCSTDNSANIIKEFCRKDTRIKYLKTEYNTGSPSMPRNIAIDFSQGQYIAFLDADDVWLPNKLSEQLDFLIQNGYKIVYSNYNIISSDGFFLRSVKARKRVDYNGLLLHSEINCSSAFLLKSLIENIRFKQVGKEDYLFFLTLLKERDLVAYNTNVCHFLYRIVHNSRSSNKLQMLQQQWYILRNKEKLGFFQSAYNWLGYVILNIKKYYLAGR